jgi:hypothetical protein
MIQTELSNKNGKKLLGFSVDGAVRQATLGEFKQGNGFSSLLTTFKAYSLGLTEVIMFALSSNSHQFLLQLIQHASGC